MLSFSTETTFYVSDQAVSTSSTPTLINDPISFTQTGKAYYLALEGMDADGDSLAYRLTTPKKSRTEAVDNYLRPDDPAFYKNYPSANQDGTNKPSFSIRPSGQIRWDAPDSVGAYTVDFEMLEYRQINGEPILMSSTTVDYTIFVWSDINSYSKVHVNTFGCLSPEETFDFKIISNNVHYLKVSEAPAFLINDKEFIQPEYQSIPTGSIDFSIGLVEYQSPTDIRVEITGANKYPTQSFTYRISDQCPTNLLSSPKGKEEAFAILYPNPANDWLHLTGHSTYRRYTILSMDGKLLGSGDIVENQIDVSLLPRGNYLIRLFNDDVIETLRFSK